MPEESPALLTYLCIIGSGLFVLILTIFFMCLKMSSRIARIERLIVQKGSQKGGQKMGDTTPPETRDEQEDTMTVTPGGQFERFLSEDPARKLLPKKEQSIAFRKWRHQQGMNWSNS